MKNKPVCKDYPVEKDGAILTPNDGDCHPEGDHVQGQLQECTMERCKTQTVWQMVREENCYLAYDDVCILKDDYSDSYGERFDSSTKRGPKDKIKQLKDLAEKRSDNQTEHPSDRHRCFYDRRFKNLKVEWHRVQNSKGEPGDYVAYYCTKCFHTSKLKNDKTERRVISICVPCFEKFEENKKTMKLKRKFKDPEDGLIKTTFQSKRRRCSQIESSGIYKYRTSTRSQRGTATRENNFSKLSKFGKN